MSFKLDRYLVRSLIAQGGMADVFFAHPTDAVTKAEIVAIKRIKPELAGDAAFARMFFDEAQISRQLDHPNIATLLDWGEADGVPFLVMEFISGVDVALVVKRGPLPAHLVAEIGIAVAEALDHAHEQCDSDGEPLGIVHRDVTPHNVMLTFDGGTKLLDFGIALARVRAERTQPGILKGKWNYMSPEQVGGKPLDRRSDLFSLGTLMYEMLTSKRAFKESSPAETLAAVALQDPTPIDTLAPDTPPELIAIVNGCMAKDAKERPARATEVAEALRAFLASSQQTDGPTLQEHLLSLFPERAGQVATVLGDLEAGFEAIPESGGDESDTLVQVVPFVRSAADVEQSTPSLGVEPERSEKKTAPDPGVRRASDTAGMSKRSLLIGLLAVVLGLATGVGLMFAIWYLGGN